jgi:hypothetical protein
MHRYNAAMTRLLLITLCLAIAWAPFDPHPLTESQLVRLETADDGSATVDEAGLYALLENAADWSTTEAGAVVPSYDAIRRDPQAWRGTRCLIEGTAYRVLRPKLGRSGWEKVQGVVVRIDHSRADPVAQDFVIVYLTDPPAWSWPNTRYEREGIPFREPAPVRLVARFLKTTTDVTQGSKGRPPEEKMYLAFVGRSAAFSAVAPAGRRGPVPGLPLLAVLAVAALVFLIWRLKSLGQGVNRRSRLRDYLEQRQERRVARGEEEPAVGDEEELPGNPAEALDTLADKRRVEDH